MLKNSYAVKILRETNALWVFCLIKGKIYSVKFFEFELIVKMNYVKSAVFRLPFAKISDRENKYLFSPLKK